MQKDFSNLTFEEIETKFECRKFAAAPVIDAGMVIKSKHMNERDMVVKIDDHNVGPFDAVGIPVKLEKTPGEIVKGSPLLGEHTASVLKELGYSDEEIQSLEEDGVVEIHR